MSSIKNIYFNSQKITFFAKEEINARALLSAFKQTEAGSGISDQFRISTQLEALNQAIQNLISNPRQLTSLGPQKHIFVLNANRLNERLNQIHATRMENIAVCLERIIASIPIRTSPQPHQLNIAPEEPIPQIVMDQGVEAEVERNSEALDKWICHKEFDELQKGDEICCRLYEHEEWKEAIDEGNPELFIRFPAIYLAHVKKGVPLDELALECAPNKSPTPRLAHWITETRRFRKRNERFVLLIYGPRREEIQQLRNLNLASLNQEDLEKAVNMSMKAESLPLIAAALERPLSDQLLNELTLWLTERKQDSLLSQLLTHSPRQKQILFQAMDKADYWGHETTFDLLFENYPHNQKEDREALLCAFADRGMSKGIDRVLSVHYGHTFDQSAIDQAFTDCLNQRWDECLGCFLKANPLPSPELMRSTFITICEDNSFEWLEPFFPHMGDEEAFVLAKQFAVSPIRWEIKARFLALFLASRLHRKLTPAQIENIVTEAAQRGHSQVAHAFLDTPIFRGMDEPARILEKERFQKILIKTAAAHHWNTFEILLNHPRYEDSKVDALNNAFVTFPQSFPLHLACKYINLVIPSAVRREYALRAVQEANIHFLRELYGKFGQSIPFEITEAAYKLAEQRQNAEAAGFLLSQIWHHRSFFQNRMTALHNSVS